MVKSKKKRKEKKKGKKPKKESKKEAKAKLLRSRLKWVREQLADAEEKHGKRCVAYFNCAVSDTKRFPRVRRLMEESKAEVNRWKAETFRLESLIKHGEYKEID